MGSAQEPDAALPQGRSTFPELVTQNLRWALTEKKLKRDGRAAHIKHTTHLVRSMGCFVYNKILF